ncbi:hypothetical protein CFP71_04345 [Amycolatopsis thailandensis]|uniref:DUF2185 domain-containing protein n=1 Tax=Amycolatopsis thailandensis TaxID=589330 RepID=A0A229SH67_9PSEU|nr:hypothetical protein [Amycolatopsis thailandensis]OXM58238.1 hypothetical protein CFP71_04345 [Amycolatopsis thailandensis]
MSSENWPLRQDPESPVIISRSLVEDPSNLAFVVLDDDGDWFISDGNEFSEDMDLNRDAFGALPLRDAVELIPELTALAGLPTGMAADWDPERRSWLLSSVADSDDDEEDLLVRAARLAAWTHPGSPLEEVQVSTELAEISTDPAAPARAVRQVVREADGSWLLVGFQVPEDEDFEVEALEMEHAVTLYPDVALVLSAAPGQVYDRPSADAPWELVEG